MSDIYGFIDWYYVLMAYHNDPINIHSLDKWLYVFLLYICVGMIIFKVIVD